MGAIFGSKISTEEAFGWNNAVFSHSDFSGYSTVLISSFLYFL